MARLPLVSPLDRILFLKAQPYLERQPPEVLTALGSFTEEQHYAAGERIRRGGWPVERVLFLAEGVVEIDLEIDGVIRTRRIEAPGIVGLPDWAAHRPAAPEVRALDETLTLEIEDQDLAQMLDDHSALLLNFVRRTAEQALMVERGLGEARPAEPGFPPTDVDDTPVELDLVHRLARARRAPLFAGENLTLVGQMTRFGEVERIAPEQPLWRIGDPIDRLALVLDGEFRTEGPFGPGRAPAGAAIGALESMGTGRREESWIAERASRILWIRRSLFVDLLEDHPEFAHSVHAKAAERALDAWASELARSTQQDSAR